MNIPSSGHDTGSVRPVMQPRRPAGVGKIEKAKDPRSALARLIAYLRPFKVGLFGVFAFVLIYTFLGLIGPYLMGSPLTASSPQNKSRG